MYVVEKGEREQQQDERRAPSVVFRAEAELQVRDLLGHPCTLVACDRYLAPPEA